MHGGLILILAVHIIKKINKMAVIGDKTWEKWITNLAEPFYSIEAKFFDPDDIKAAWKWLKE